MDSILTPAQKEQYYADGYLLVQGVFKESDIQAIRQLFLQEFKSQLYLKAPYSDASIINDIFSYFPNLVRILFSVKFIGIIKELISDDAVWIPECSIHRNRYIHWHKDTSIQELHGELSHRDTSSPLIQSAIYFQDNTTEYGGGLTVISGSHLAEDHYHTMFSNSVLKRVYFRALKLLRFSPFDKMELSPFKKDIPSKVGDLVLFDVRLDHRATKPVSLQNTSDKFAIFNTFGKKNDVTRRYFEFMKARPEPYYKYFKEVALPDIVYQNAAQLGIEIWY